MIGTGIATNPAAANDVHSIVKFLGLTTCTNPSPCTEFKNTGSGPAIKGDGTSGEGIVAVSQSSNAVRGTTTNPSSRKPARSGVLGVDSSNDGGTGNTGVSGFSTNGTGAAGASTNGSGVVGTTSSISAFPRAGVSGIDKSTQAASNSGVSGSSTIGIGVLGSSQAGAGVSAFSLDSFGVRAESSDQGTALLAVDDLMDRSPAAQVIGGTTDPSTISLETFDGGLSPTFWVDNGGNAHVRGLIITGGPCSAGCLKTKGSPASQVQRYTPQESSPTIEDVGEAQLSGGSAYVRIDAAFASVMATDAPYLVFVTPQGFTRGLYVTNKSPQGFQVQEVPGGQGSVVFDYRIVAKPFGENARRLPMVSGADLPKAPTRPRLMRPASIPTSMQH